MSETPTAESATETALATAREEKAPIKIGERGVAFESASEMFRLCQALVQGGVTPKGMTPGAVMASMLKGRALGLDEITAVTSITVINGRTQTSGSVLLALFRRAGIEYDIWHDGEDSTRTAHIRAWWPGRKDRAKQRDFGMKDAARAGLLGKDSYKAWPDDMLLWRAVAKLARQEFPEIGAGVYVHGEIPGDPEPSVALADEARSDGTIAPVPPPPPDPLIAELSGKPVELASHSEKEIPLEPETKPAEEWPSDPNAHAKHGVAPADPAAVPSETDFSKPPSSQRKGKLF